MKNLLVTGGAGFIGSNFVHYALEKYPDWRIVVFDKLNYRGNLDNLKDVEKHPRYAFVRGDICDAAAVSAAIEQHDIDTVVNFAAETHVVRSIMDPDAFIRTDVYGTFVLLKRRTSTSSNACTRFDRRGVRASAGRLVEGDRSDGAAQSLRGQQGQGGLVAFSYYTTYGTPITITRGANNIGPYQYPENVVPLFITNAIDDQPLPVYGGGRQVRPYQYVMDHIEGIDLVLHKGELGEAYNIGPDVETPTL